MIIYDGVEFRAVGGLQGAPCCAGFRGLGLQVGLQRKFGVLVLRGGRTRCNRTRGTVRYCAQKLVKYNK